jgi:hypothetical protein
MDETSDSAPDETAAESPAADNPAGAPERGSRFGTSHRTNRMLAAVLAGIAAGVVTVLIFSAGVFVGAEMRHSDGYRHMSDGFSSSEGDHFDGDSNRERDSYSEEGGDHGEYEHEGAPQGPRP